MINIAACIEEVCEHTHLPAIRLTFGEPGMDAAFEIMQAAKTLYRHVELERVKGRIIIFQKIVAADAAPAPPVVPAIDFGALANDVITDLVIEIASDKQAYLVSEILVLEELAKSAVVYHWQGGQEEFLAGATRKSVLRLDKAARSQFAVPTLPTLRVALKNYSVENVRESSCYIFREAWHDQNRLFFKAKAESIMRTSLTQFLKNRIGGDHDVWAEQNVDESHPVDIRVKPRLTNNRVMLIEIKWLGCSAASDGHITAKHGQPRAQAGATQLAQYLDDQRQSAPTSVIHGYYVIIDGRRNNLQQGATSISASDGLHFEQRELTFDPPYHTTREDFDPPYRMFAKPVCSDQQDNV
jgi:hypothetical protein